MSNALYPVLKGCTFDIERKPVFTTEIQRTVSGRETRAALMLYPLDEWTLHYNVLQEATDFATLIGFWKQRRGAFDSFLFTAATYNGTPIDSKVTGQLLGNGTGSLADFAMLRALGGFSEFVENCAVSAVYFNGAAQSAGNYSVTSVAPGYLNNLHFSAGLPGAGVAVSADFTYSWRMRFKDDALPFGNFMTKLWELKQVSLVQVKN